MGWEEGWKSKYREEKAKAYTLEDAGMPRPHRRKKTSTRSDHKHFYVPCVCYTVNNDSVPLSYGYVCNQCGRILDMTFYSFCYLKENFEHFVEKHPDLIKVYLPEDWNWFKNKNIPIMEE